MVKMQARDLKIIYTILIPRKFLMNNIICSLIKIHLAWV